MMFSTTYAISRIGTTVRLIRDAYRQWRQRDYPRGRAAVLAVKYFDL